MTSDLMYKLEILATQLGRDEINRLVFDPLGLYVDGPTLLALIVGIKPDWWTVLNFEEVEERVDRVLLAIGQESRTVEVGE